jgi:hypothetical protein
VAGERRSGLLVLLMLCVRRKMAGAIGVVILCVRRKMTWATDVVNIMCQEKDGLGYWCC